jgi:stage III sporulation protein SpoIIIAA
LVEDQFDKCPQQDLITYANGEVPRVLLIGKPRSGKTTVA